MTLKSRLLLTTAALSLALSAGVATAQTRAQQPVQNGATQNSTQNQVPNNNQAQAPNSSQAGTANNNGSQAAQGQDRKDTPNNDQASDKGGNAPTNNARTNNGRMDNNARSNATGANPGSPAPASGNAAQNKQPAGTNQNAQRGAQPNEQNAQQPSSASGSRAGQPAAADRGTERNDNGAQQSGGRNENAANPAPERSGSAARGEESSRVSTRLSSTEKAHLESAIGKISVRPAANVNFSVAVGTSVPGSVVLHPLPADVVAIVPQYRGYDFFVVRDEVVIVEPSTHKIVDVIERTGGARTAERSRTHKLHLSARDRTYIRKHYATRRTTIVDRAEPARERHIVVGEDVPETVTIERFPREVYHRVPSIRPYGYVHEGRDVYLVEPGTRHVIESIGPDEDD